MFKTFLRKVIKFITVPFVLLGFLLFTHPVRAAIPWNLSTIDSGGDVGAYTSITVDNSNNYLISHYDSADDDLKFTKSTDGGTTWTTSTVDSTGDVGRYTSIAVDNLGNYLISYRDETNTSLKFAKSTNGGTSWDTIVTVDNTADMGLYCTSITTDDSNNYLISYHDNTNYVLKFAKSINGGTSWDTIIVVADDALVDGIYSSITTDSLDNYLIAYNSRFDMFTYNLKFAKSIDGGISWTKSIVESNQYGDYNSITTDASDSYLIAYYDFSNIRLKFAKSTDGGTSWTTKLIDSSSEAGQGTSIKVDLVGNYLIAYHEDSTYILKFAISTDSGENWTVSTIDDGDNTGYYPSLAVDSLGNYLVSYKEGAPGGGFEFAKGDASAPTLTITNPVTNPTDDNTPSIGGTAVEFLGTVVSVQYQVDGTGGSWNDCVSMDGVFDEVYEIFSCNIETPLAGGIHTVYIRATDSLGNTTLSGREVTNTFTINVQEEGNGGTDDLTGTGKDIYLMMFVGILILIGLISRKRLFEVSP